MKMLTVLSSAMRRLAAWPVLALTAAGFAVSAYLLFATSMPFAIPTVTALCNGAPPDMRFYTSGPAVGNFLAACGDPGRAAYTHLQLADLFYPSVSGLFLASALATVLSRLVQRGGALPAAAALPLLGAVFDYLENAAAWSALAAHPEPIAAADLLGYASAAKQVCSWASWTLLIVATVLLTIRALRLRGKSAPSEMQSVATR